MWSSDRTEVSWTVISRLVTWMQTRVIVSCYLTSLRLISSSFLATEVVFKGPHFVV